MPNILLVEDYEITAESIVFALENDYESFNVHWSANGNDALEHFYNNHVDLILLDVTLPDINGFDILQKIRRTSDVPIIMVTARADESDIVVSLTGMGANDYVTKPFRINILVARIKTQLKQAIKQHNIKDSVSLKNDTIEQEFKINKDLYQILLHGQVVNLTRAECKILMYMVEHPNRVHSKEHLLNIMHDRRTSAGESTIVTHIRRIRIALKAINTNNNSIKTHIGLGYSLVI